jgi:hypothetical protein
MTRYGLKEDGKYGSTADFEDVVKEVELTG